MDKRAIDLAVKKTLNGHARNQDQLEQEKMSLVKYGYALGTQSVVTDVLNLVRAGALRFQPLADDAVPEQSKNLYLLVSVFVDSMNAGDNVSTEAHVNDESVEKSS